MTDWVAFTTMVLVFLRTWEEVIYPSLVMLKNWLWPPQPVSDSTHDGHVDPDLLAAIGQPLARIQRNMQILQAEIRDMRNEQSAQQSQQRRPNRPHAINLSRKLEWRTHMLKLSMTSHEIASDTIAMSPFPPLVRSKTQGAQGSGTSDELALLRSAGD